MWAADLILVDTAEPDAGDDPHGFARGLVYLVVFSVPLWSAIICLACLAL
jgi:hypothetical protein